MSDKMKAFELQEAEIKRLSNMVEALEIEKQKLEFKIDGMNDVSRLNVTTMVLAGMVDKIDEIGVKDAVIYCEVIAEVAVSRFEKTMEVKADEFYDRMQVLAEKQNLGNSEPEGQEN